MRFWIVASLALGLMSCDAPEWYKEHQFKQRCEVAIKDRLKAPATYKRASIHEFKGFIKQGSYAHRTESKRKHNILYEFDSQNGFGALIRGHALCSKVTLASQFDYDNMDFNVLIIEPENYKLLIAHETLAEQAEK